MRQVTTSIKSSGITPIAALVDPGVDFYLDEIKLHLSAAGGAGTLTISIDAAAGSAHDIVLVSQDMTTVVDLIYIPDVKIHQVAGDKIKVDWANAAGKTFGLDVTYTKIAGVR